MNKKPNGTVNLPDTNVWLALALSAHGNHSAARNWFAAQSVHGSVLFCRPTQQSLLRLLTTAGVMHLYGVPPYNNHGAFQLIESFLTDAHIAFCPEPPSIVPIWKSFASRQTPSPKLWMDAYLAAFAVAGNHELITIDKAFTQFKGLKVRVIS